MTLEQLSAAAAQGTMDIAAGANCHCFDGRLVVGGKCIAFVSGDQTEDDDGEFHIIADADGQFIAELWNAYRTGQLVAVQPEQPTCMLCAGKCRGHSLADSKAWEPEPGSQAFAVQPDDATVERYRHKKRGTVYEVIGSAELQVAGLAPDEGDHLAVYRGEDGKLWARPYDEFHDGRFEAMKGPKP